MALQLDATSFTLLFERLAHGLRTDGLRTTDTDRTRRGPAALDPPAHALQPSSAAMIAAAFRATSCPGWPPAPAPVRRTTASARVTAISSRTALATSAPVTRHDGPSGAASAGRSSINCSTARTPVPYERNQATHQRRVGTTRRYLVPHELLEIAHIGGRKPLAGRRRSRAPPRAVDARGNRPWRWRRQSCSGRRRPSAAR